MQLQSVSESTNRARERRILIERQLADAQTHAGARRVRLMDREPPEPAALTTAQQLEAAEARLDLYKLRYTPDHPDIRALERTIGELQAEARGGSQACRQRPADEAADAGRSGPAASRFSDLQAELEAIDHQIAIEPRGGERRLKNTDGLTIRPRSTPCPRASPSSSS